MFFPLQIRKKLVTLHLQTERERLSTESAFPPYSDYVNLDALYNITEIYPLT